MKEELTKLERSELFNIGNSMPVDAGNLLAKESAHKLVELKLAMKYEEKYVLTEKGKELLEECKKEGARKVMNSGVLYKSKSETK